jgi:CubicO group peptidase (beta-lactamase class C family)
MKNILTIAIILLLFKFSNSTAQSNAVPAFIKDSINNYINKSLTNWRVPGAAVCIVKDGRIVLMKGYGVKEIGTNDKVDENTLFMIGSNTKAFTATALAMLEQEKKLSLDDQVIKYIPEFKLENKTAGEQTNIYDLLSHRIGFETFQGDFTYWTSNLTRKQVIENMAQIKAVYPFRTEMGLQ